MKPSDILKSEHRVIEQVLNCLEKLVQQSTDSSHFDAHSAEQAIEFFRNFADRCHHGKEESHFFPALEAKGFSRHGGPTGVMLHEHEVGRQCVTGMSDALSAVQAGDSAAHGRFAKHATAFIELLREHIQKEDHCLFNMADQAFTPADQQQLLAAFTQVESEQMGIGTHEKYVRIADDLAARFHVARAESATAEGHRCCGH